jgi:pimeloyl-ACP methyl ester carboxylesterase
MEALAGRFHVLAADSFGSGQSPAWPADRPLTLRDEVDLLDPVFARAGDPHVLVGHSYGAAVALIAALAQPGRVRGLAVYEPVLFGLVDAESQPPNEADGIRGAVVGATAALDAGDPAGAAERFIDFWMGRGAWARMADSRRRPIAASIVNIRQWLAALLNERRLAGAGTRRRAAPLRRAAADRSRRVQRRQAHGTDYSHGDRQRRNHPLSQTLLTGGSGPFSFGASWRPSFRPDRDRSALSASDDRAPGAPM